MRGKVNVFLLGFASAVAWGGLGYLIFTTNPDDTNARIYVFAAILVAAFLSAATGAMLVGFRVFNEEHLRGDLQLALLQAVPPSVLLLVLAWLQSLQVLSLVIFAILFGLLVSFEYLLWPRDYEEA